MRDALVLTVKVRLLVGRVTSRTIAISLTSEAERWYTGTVIIESNRDSPDLIDFRNAPKRLLRIEFATNQ